MIRDIVRGIVAWLLLPVVFTAVMGVALINWLMEEPDTVIVQDSKDIMEGWAEWAMPWWKP